MISRREIQKTSRRSDHDDNVWVHPFSGRMASWSTWACVNLGLSANQVTLLSFVSGLTSAIILLSDNQVAAFAAFALFRLHLVLDASDGEVARYRNQISPMGVYWDQSMHFIVYPLIFACLTWGRLFNEASTFLVVFGMLGMVGKIIDYGLQNAYYRVLYTSNRPREEPTQANESSGLSGRLGHVLNIGLHFAGYDGLLFFFAVGYFVGGTWLGFAARDYVIAVYAISILLMALARMVLIPYHGRIPRRKELR